MGIIFKVIFILSIVVFVLGCGNQVDSVKNAYLTGREQTTIGNAFDTFFAETSWELKEAENKTKFVEFKGKIKKDYYIGLGMGKGDQLMVQFILKSDGTFDIGFFAGTRVGSRCFGPDQIDESLNEIYNG